MFRWDQRLFTVLLKFPGILCSDSGIIDDDIEEDSTYLQMSSLCEYTGGKEKWMDGWMDGWMDEWMDGWTDEWTDWWMDD